MRGARLARRGSSVRREPSGAALLLVLLGHAGVCGSALAQDQLRLSGFATLRGSTPADGPLDQDDAVGRLQLGLDWTSTSFFSFHVHALARTDERGSQRGVIGVPEAFLEANVHWERSRLRFRGGATFLPTSLENVDALWENPYAISSSALNTWLGEELRPVGLDASYFRGALMAGATLFRGNDTLGALPPVRGWALHDRWTLLGEKAPVDDEVFTSVSAETDARLGWSARAGWLGERFTGQYTYFDNRSDGLRYGDLYNWNTRFHIVGIGYALGDWTFASEGGWGPTYLVVRGRRFVSDIRAIYLLVSRRLPRGRASVRVDSFYDGENDDAALTLAYLFMPRGRLGAGIEFASTGGENRLTLQLRYGFAVR
jgi:hypothetical protein